MDSKILSTTEQEWLTFEVEAYGMYPTLRKWTGLLMRIDQLGPGTWPPLLCMDGLYDGYVKMDRGIGVTGYRSRKREGEEGSDVGREDIICETYEDRNAMDCRVSE